MVHAYCAWEGVTRKMKEKSNGCFKNNPGLFVLFPGSLVLVSSLTRLRYPAQADQRKKERKKERTKERRSRGKSGKLTRLIHQSANLRAHQGTGSSVDDQLGHGGEEIGSAADLVVPALKVGTGLLLNLGNVGTEGIVGHAPLDKLLLLHQHVVGAIIDDTLSKDRGGQGRVGLFCRDVGGLCVEDEVVALDTEADGELAADHGVGEDVAVLRAVVGIELERVDTELDGGSEVWDPVRDLWGSILVDVDPLLDLGEDEDDDDTDGKGGEDMVEVGRVEQAGGQGLDALDQLDNDGHCGDEGWRERRKKGMRREER